MTWYSVNFGSNKAGLANVGYREYDNTGGDSVARTQAGVVDAGDGMYGVDVTLNAATVGLQWDTGEAVPVFANEDVNQLQDLDDKIDIIDGNVDLILIDTTAIQLQNIAILSDTADIIAQNVLILVDTAQLLVDVAAVKGDTAQILLDTTQLLLDTAALNAQNIVIIAGITQVLLDIATVDGVVDQILLDTTQLLLDAVAILSDTNAILLDTDNINTLLSDIEGGRDIREILRMIVASANNLLSGAESGSTEIILTKLNGTGVRQRTTVDEDGNRLAIVSRDFTP